MPVTISRPIAPEGPLVEIAVAVSRAEVAAREKIGVMIQDPVQSFGLIDTGSDGTFLHSLIIAYLGLQTVGVISVTSHGGTENVPLVRAALSFTHDGGKTAFHEFVVARGDALRPGVQLLIGRDILQHCSLGYDGPAGKFQLTIH